MSPLHLPPPARYVPLDKGVYEVAAGLRKFGAPLGGGLHDSLVFPFDSGFTRFRANKLACRAERLGKYCALSGYEPATEQAVAAFLAGRLASEHPSLFASHTSTSGLRLECRLTSETLGFDEAFQLREASQPPEGPAYAHALDALASQLQEDVAVVQLRNDTTRERRAPEGREAWRDRLVALHLCAPSHWAAEDKIGKDFITVHAPIPHVEKLNAASAQLLEACLFKGPYVRFVWGFGGDDVLNRHPATPHPHPHGHVPQLRVERQLLWGLPHVEAIVFLIRTYFIDGEDIRSNERERALLKSAMLSMSPASRSYKGLANGRLEELLTWLG
jgi:hypothetical protein